MTWDTIAVLIAKYGVDFAYQVWQIVSTNTTPTQAQWDALLAMSRKTLAQYVEEAQKAKDAEPPPASPS